METRKYQIFIFGLGVNLLLSLVPFWTFGVPTVFFPMPVYIVISAMAHISWLLGASIFCLVWIFFIDKDLKTFKRRSLIFNFFMLTSTLIWFLYAKEYAVRQQGIAYYTVCLIQNLIINTSLWLCWHNATPFKSRIYILLLSFFLIGYAFPYFGELP